MPTFTKSIVATCVVDCPSPQQPKPSHWITIQLVTTEGKPVVGEEYQVTLPDGTPVFGFTNDAGEGRVPNIAKVGTCRITFPRLDQHVCRAMT